MSERKEVKIEDILLIPSRNGLTKPSAIRGKGAKMIAMGELFAHPIICDIDMDRVPVNEKELKSSSIEINDLLFARQSLTLEGAGKCSIVKEVNEPTVFESHLIRLRIDSNLADPWYVYYYFNSYYGKHSIQNIVNQVAAAGIKGSDLVKLEIPLPSLDIQNKIAAQLSEIDDKIAVNKKICENLEAQAQALFKHWFIDFTPFKDGKFVESELGLIPEGWRVATLNEVCLKVTDGSHYSLKDDPLGNIPMLSVKDMQHNGFDYSSCKKISEEEYIKMKANDCVPLKNDILVAKDGSYLKEIFLCFEEIKQAILSSIAIFRCNNTIIFPEILLQILRLPKIKKDVGDNFVSGTALPRIVLKDFKKYRFILAPIEVQDKIVGTFRSINAQIYKSEQESSRLAQLRDTLLPKLMSGQINLNEIEKNL